MHITNNKAQSIKDKLRKISKEKEVNFNIIMRSYIYDRFIERLSKSKYKKNFIIKGGFYLSRVFGIDNRSTLDIDTAIKGTDFTEENIIIMITDIINIKLDDDIKFKINKIEPIREMDEYGGVRVTINFTLENIKETFHIDIATGDPIYPGPIEYGYESIIGDEVYKVWSYSLETVLSEKLETVLSQLESTSRMKDYYDIYLIGKLKLQKMSKEKLKVAISKTFKKRNFTANLDENLSIIKESKILKDRWKSYAKSNIYANKIEYEEILNYLEKTIDKIK